MSMRSLKFLLLSSLGLSLFLGNSVAFAQSNDSNNNSNDNSNNSDVVVPTQSGRTTPTTTPGNTSTPTSIPTSRQTTVSSGTRFTCQYYNGQYTVMYQPQTQPGQYFAWASPRTLGGGWDTQKRCNTIAQRLESYRPDGLQELRTSSENGYNTVCVTTQSNPACRIVLTVPPDKDANQVRNDVFQNLSSADNGQQTTAVSTFTGSGQNSTANQVYNLGRNLLGSGKNRVANSGASAAGINLKPFLDPQDGGNGSRLHNGVGLRRPNSQPSLRLNPSLFR